MAVLMADDKPKPQYRYTANDPDIRHPIIGRFMKKKSADKQPKQAKAKKTKGRRDDS